MFLEKTLSRFLSHYGVSSEKIWRILIFRFPFSLGLSGHSLFNVYNKSILLCYWMINQESRQSVPLNFHLLLVQPAVLISNVHEGAIQNYWIEPFLSHHLCRKMVWHAYIEFFCIWLENCQFALLWCTHDPPKIHRPDGSSELFPYCIKFIPDHLVEFSFAFAGATQDKMKLKPRKQMNAYPPCLW